MRDLLRMLARALVDESDRVSVEEYQDDDVTVLELEVAPEDRGKVIGKKGRTAEALRTVLEVVGRHRGRRYELEILD